MDAESLVTHGWMLPGLVDAHAHLALASPLTRGPAGKRARASAKAHLDAGVLLVREPGGPDRASAGIGPQEGLPRVVTGGQFLSPPGGYFPGLAREVAPDDLPHAAAEEAEASGAWAKVIGDFVDPEGRLVPNWDYETLRKAAQAVHATGGRIAIHALLPQVIGDAIEARFDSIEHGVGLQSEHLDAMVDRKTALVPTLLIRDAALEMFSSMLHPAAFSDLRTWVSAWPARAAEASRKGVTVLAGTDAGMGPHGMVSQEVMHLLQAGLSPEGALGAASWTARAYLGLPGLEEGGPGDVVVFPEDPRKDARVLQRPAVVLLDGRRVRPPGSRTRGHEPGASGSPPGSGATHKGP